WVATGFARQIGRGDLARCGLLLDRHRGGGRWRLRGNALCQCIEVIEVAADAKAAIATETPLAIEHRQPRHLDRKAPAVAGRPADREPAESVMGCERARDLPVGIEAKRRRDGLPAQPEHGLRAWERRDFVRAEGEAPVAIDLPDEPERLPALRRSW